MRTKTTAALTLLLCAVFAIPSAALAGKGGPKEDPNRDPSEKECANVELSTACSDELNATYKLIGDLLAQDPAVFLSRNAERDAGSLQCKTSGAEIKLNQDYKEDEAWYLMETAKQKVEDLFAQSKLTWGGRAMLLESFQAAQDCIDSL
jgi:hypothetical protein